ncbi:MAG TPA: NUDIX domain-containing protein [Candidatus Levybacteria bacterium]|nr:NUDIX domain-containing protein [Candidatus Levybacteria bacterium]
MKKYTVGFIFNTSLTKVLLIHKLHPQWQNGKINGVGGKIEPGEDSIDCIVREIREETGLITQKNLWKFAGKNCAPDWEVDFYACMYNGQESDAKTLTDEKVEWFLLSDLPDNLIPNLKWLIPLTLNKLTDNEYKECSVQYAQ